MSEVKYEDLHLKAEVMIGDTSIALKDVEGLGEGSIITLDQDKGEELVIRIQGIPKWKGELVSFGEKVGVRITSAY